MLTSREPGIILKRIQPKEGFFSRLLGSFASGIAPVVMRAWCGRQTVKPDGGVEFLGHQNRSARDVP